MITGKMIHEAFNAATPDAIHKDWSLVSERAKKRYEVMARELNTAAGLPQPCPFCAFYEKPARPIAPGVAIGPVGCCAECGAGPDIREVLLDWLEAQA